MRRRTIPALKLLFILSFCATPNLLQAQRSPAVAVAEALLEEIGQRVLNFAFDRAMDKGLAKAYATRLKRSQDELRLVAKADVTHAALLKRLIHQLGEQHKIVTLIAASTRHDSAFIASVVKRQHAILEDNRVIKSLLRQMKSEQTDNFAQIQQQFDILPERVAAAVVERQGREGPGASSEGTEAVRAPSIPVPEPLTQAAVGQRGQESATRATESSIIRNNRQPTKLPAAVPVLGQWQVGRRASAVITAALLATSVSISVSSITMSQTTCTNGTCTTDGSRMWPPTELRMGAIAVAFGTGIFGWLDARAGRRRLERLNRSQQQ
jgi:hypothetical protein